MELEDEYELLCAMYPDEFELDLVGKSVFRKEEFTFLITLGDDYPENVPRIELDVPWVHWEKTEDLVIAAREACELGTPMLSTIVGTVYQDLPDKPVEEVKQRRGP
jgi:hypothetical protein